NFSTARNKPKLPSWIKSRRPRLRPIYFLAIDTTKRRLASVNFLRAATSPLPILLASSTSSYHLIRKLYRFLANTFGCCHHKYHPNQKHQPYLQLSSFYPCLF